MPSDELTADLYEIAVERLAQMGIRRYEISNFARPGCESRHNLKYWRLEPYIGFGADAHSFDGRMRWQNAETAGEYVERPRAAGEPGASRSEERFFVGLRLTEASAPSRPSGSASTRRSSASSTPACSNPTAACCA